MQETSLTDHLLIAMPGLADPNFDRGVTYVCQHNAEGAVGLLINRRSEYSLSDVFEQMDITATDAAALDVPVYSGGPVRPDRGFVLHTPHDDYESSLRLTDHLAWTTSRDVLEAAALGEGPEKMLVALGYAGWGAGQLEDELRQNSWLTSRSEPRIIFDTPVDQRWHESAAVIGVDIRLLGDHAGTA